MFKSFFPFYSKLEQKEKTTIKIEAFLFFIVAAVILGYFTYMLQTDSDNTTETWNKIATGNPQVMADVNEVGKNATKVLCGTYVEGIHDVNMAHGGYWVNFLTWFRWDGDEIQDMAHHYRVYRGLLRNLIS
jgi:hypothetical protein